MGFKSSMVTVTNPSATLSERDLLDRLGFTHFEFTADTTLEECMYPGDKSLNIGYYNNSLIICDDYQLSGLLETISPESAAGYEQVLSALFPGSEVLTTACHSAVNYHLYALAKDGKRIRFKDISSETSLREFGRHLQEEDEVYKLSKVVDGKRLFTSNYSDKEEYEYEEDQMMEAFTFGVAKRHLGVLLDYDESETLTFNTPFKKYKQVRANTTARPAATAVATVAAPQPTEQAAGQTASWFTRLRKKLGI